MAIERTIVPYDDECEGMGLIVRDAIARPHDDNPRCGYEWAAPDKDEADVLRDKGQ